jgi:hypothetical protein
MSVASRRDRRSSRPSRRPEQSADSDGQLQRGRHAAAGFRRQPGLLRVTRTGITAGSLVSESVVAGRLGHDGRDPDRADHLRAHSALPRQRRRSVHNHAINDSHAVVDTHAIIDTHPVYDDHHSATTAPDVGGGGATGRQLSAPCRVPAPCRAASASPPSPTHPVDDHVAAHRDYPAARFLRRGRSGLGGEAASVHR